MCAARYPALAGLNGNCDQMGTDSVFPASTVPNAGGHQLPGSLQQATVCYITPWAREQAEALQTNAKAWQCWGREPHLAPPIAPRKALRLPSLPQRPRDPETPVSSQPRCWSLAPGRSPGLG